MEEIIRTIEDARPIIETFEDDDSVGELLAVLCRGLDNIGLVSFKKTFDVIVNERLIKNR